MREIKDIVEEQVKIFDMIKLAVFNKFEPDLSKPDELKEFQRIVSVIYPEVNDMIISAMIDEGKKKRMDSYHGDASQKTTTGGGGEDSPTAKQISYATQLGIQVEGKNYTKKQLSELIDKKVKK